MYVTEIGMSDFFQGPPEWASKSPLQSRKLGRFTDLVFDAKLALSTAYRKLSAANCSPQRILITGVLVPGREADMARVQSALSSSRHSVRFLFSSMKPKGKFDNINDAIADPRSLLDETDWLLIVDDDVKFPKDFIDNLMELLVPLEVDVAQPAHRLFSHTSWRLTSRKWGSLIRRSAFVEIGPVTIFGKKTFADLLPFPHMRWCWGLDAFWAHLAREKSWKMAIVDATPVQHLKPVAISYDRQVAEREGTEFLRSKNVTMNKSEMMAPGSVWVGW